jgi:hypothetical protein
MSTTSAFSPAYEALPRGKAAPVRKGLFQRLIDRLIESRMRRAEAFIRQNSHLLPRELEEQGRWKITERSEDSLPFVR